MSDPVQLSIAEQARYARHLTLPQVGLAGQQKLASASILVVGAGGLGSPLLMYLAAAGIGRMGIVDADVVDTSNLQRQILHGDSDVGRLKVQSAAESIRNINPHVQVDLFGERLTSDNAMQIADPYDLIIDGTDNFATRYLVNDVCVLLGKPNCYGSIFQFEGQASVFGFAGGPCYRCLYPIPPDPGAVPSCAEGGVLGVLPGIIGTIQATEAIKIILGQGNTLSGRLLLYDALEMSFRELQVRRDKNCPVCGDQPTILHPIDYQQFCGVSSVTKPGTGTVDDEITPAELKSRIEAGSQFLLLDVRQPHEYQICHLGGILIPLDQLADRIDELDRSVEIIVHCKLGGRSRQAITLLQQHGFERLKNLSGGIIAWAEQLDPTMPRY